MRAIFRAHLGAPRAAAAPGRRRAARGGRAPLPLLRRRRRRPRGPRRGRARLRPRASRATGCGASRAPSRRRPRSDPLARSRAVDPELREIFGFGPPLPRRPSRPARRHRRVSTSPTPGSAPGRAAGAAPRRPSSRLLDALGRALAGLRGRAGVRGAGPRRRTATVLSRRLNRWAPSPADFRDYLPLAGRLLRATAADVAARPLAAPYRDLFPALLLATGWQESCWRQYVRRGGAARAAALAGRRRRHHAGERARLARLLRRLRRCAPTSPTTRAPAARSCSTTCEDFAIARGEDRAGGGSGPRALHLRHVQRRPRPHAPLARARRRPPSLRAIDASFLREVQGPARRRRGGPRALLHRLSRGASHQSRLGPTWTRSHTTAS